MKKSLPSRSFLLNVGFMLTYRCTIACPHCIVEAGPHRNETMDLDSALNWISQAAGYGNGYIKGCALTGGEVFYDLEKLRVLSDHAGSLGLIVSTVTNAFWATTKGTAVNILKSLPAIRLVCVSTDAYHQRFIQLDSIRNAIEATKELGLSYTIAVCKDAEDSLFFRQLVEQLRVFAAPDKIIASKTFPVGRARRNINMQGFPLVPEPTGAACTMASSPVIFPDGRVIGCIGPAITIATPNPLLLGNLHVSNLRDVLDCAEGNTILHAIRVWGPHKILAGLRRIGCPEELPLSFIKDCTCDACYKLLSNPKLLPYIKKLAQDKELTEKTAYGRLFYLNEDTMIKTLGTSSAVGNEGGKNIGS